ncbi:MAG: twin-arginine translocase subunit TatB [Thiotrichales bacterium]|nr:twin-arginine translocase subunit TatB [Thiotrichales bacterium]MBT4653027.1 twin-arginine translocase subunit TatB [Thiotrichales bacterium]
MFDFGFWEIAIIGIITLIVVGPERMPSLARKAGIYAGKLNKFVKKIKFDIDEELKVDELKEQLSIKNEESVLSQAVEDVKTSAEQYQKEVIEPTDPNPQPSEDLQEDKEAKKNDFSIEEYIKSEPQKKDTDH